LVADQHSPMHTCRTIGIDLYLEGAGGIMAETILKIEGMSCQHCVMRVKKAIDLVPGVSRSDVSIGEATIEFDESQTRKQDLEEAIEKAGYKVIG
jgi:copper chaperone